MLGEYQSWIQGKKSYVVSGIDTGNLTRGFKEELIKKIDNIMLYVSGNRKRFFEEYEKGNINSKSLDPIFKKDKNVDIDSNIYNELYYDFLQNVSDDKIREQYLIYVLKTITIITMSPTEEIHASESFCMLGSLLYKYYNRKLYNAYRNKFKVENPDDEVLNYRS